MAIDHGAPLLNITAEPAPALLEPLLAGGWIAPWSGLMALLEGESKLHIGRPDMLGQGSLYGGVGGMDGLCRGLLQLAARPSAPSVTSHYRTLVRFLDVADTGTWRLRDRSGSLVGEAEWLVLSSTLLAHPRSRLLFDWPAVPMAEAAAKLGDLQLDHALTTIAGIRAEARSNLLLIVPEEDASPWRALPFTLVNFDAAAQQCWGLRRISIQPLADGRCTVVAHSSDAFAADHLDVYGSRSAVARLLALPPEAGREEQVIEALSQAVLQCLAPWIDAGSLERAAPQLMRWGAAFPVAPGLPQALMLCPGSRVGFCGDFLAGPGFGRIEGALRSAELLANALLQAGLG
ncbi:hypothetical protein [Cyanobium sp. NIES-981]|uniref:hypothetical protein n=1 Tax=Cyanobium sp. NIES-981 TaxID=1851505 RepID=UPI0007DDAEED|nr:hypothetical protein [Cyanobium sp. NIES-981]SBO41873.1 conserved protein of unknown function [Cyanobium sp. NIES-981]